jgi:hypothetical protein
VLGSPGRNSPTDADIGDDSGDRHYAKTLALPHWDSGPSSDLSGTVCPRFTTLHSLNSAIRRFPLEPFPAGSYSAFALH